MSSFYDPTYRNFGHPVYADVRGEAFGEDLGQNSWLTAGEQERFAEWLGIGPGDRVLDVACGSGGPALRLAERHGCEVVGIDIHGDGIAHANAQAVSRGLDGRARFQTLDAGKPLPYEDGAFDAVISIDAINHFPDRNGVLAEWSRVVKPSGRVLFTDPTVVTGAISHRELAARSVIGFFLFVPPGEDERCLRAAGLRLAAAEDVTLNVCDISRRWLGARADRDAALRELEGDLGFEEVQEFLTTVERLSRERRLSRFAFVAEKPEGPERPEGPE